MMNPCCVKQENREVVEQSENRKVEKCRECGRKHYEMTVDPVVIGVEGKGV